MQDQLAKFAYSGQWNNVLAFCSARSPVSPMPRAPAQHMRPHEAAWHGAGLPVIGACYNPPLGRSSSTVEGWSDRPYHIAQLRHAEREDLHGHPVAPSHAV